MKLETDRDANEWVWQAKALAIVSAWSALGLFERLRAGPLARSGLPADARAVTTTLPVLVHLGLIATDGERLALTPTAERLLDARAMPTERNLVLLRDLARMKDVVRDGGPVKDDEGRSKTTRGGTVDDPAQTGQFLDMLYRISEEPAKSTFAWLAAELPASASVLDLGGGHGRYARAFADAGYTVTLFDQPPVVALARKRHGDALRYIEGDFHTVASFGGPYDLVMLCNIVHGESAEANASLVARAALSVRPGGRVAIRDMFVDEHGQNPESAVIFGVTMLLYTEHGTAPTIRQVEDWFARAGLADVRMTVLETHQIVSGRKPS
jgi:2-polyprenyl-3-methyl-5-hydroxy-6-metoxy-1,4-benzoquinol methylase